MKKAPSVTGLLLGEKHSLADFYRFLYGSNRPIIAMPATVMAMAA